MTEVQTKVCARCKVEKPVNEFGKGTKNKDGLQPYCRECNNAASCEARQRAKQKGQRMEYQTENKDEMTVHQAQQRVQVIDGKAMVDSRDIAAIFGKQHKHVIDTIRIEAEEEAEIGQPNFRPSSYINEQNKKQPCYRLTYRGFLQVAMGFTGSKARKLRIAVLDRMEELERQVAQKTQQAPAAQTTLIQGTPDLDSIEQNASEIERRARSVKQAVKTLKREGARMHETQAMSAQVWQSLADMEQAQVNATVYLMVAIDGNLKGIYKIGMTCHETTTQRNNELNVEYKTTWKLLKAITTNDKRLETAFHKALRHLRVNLKHARELFELSQFEIEKIMGMPDHMRIEDFDPVIFEKNKQCNIFEELGGLQ